MFFHPRFILLIFIFWIAFELIEINIATNRRAEIVEWKLDTDMMKFKKSCDVHLFSHDIIDFRWEQGILFSPVCTILFAIISFRLFCRRLIVNFTEDGPRGNV